MSTDLPDRLRAVARAIDVGGDTLNEADAAYLRVAARTLEMYEQGLAEALRDIRTAQRLLDALKGDLHVRR